MRKTAKSAFVSSASPFQALLLSADEEKELFQQLQTHDSRMARDRLILAFQPLVSSMAARYRGTYKFAFSDLVSEGNVGLIEALNRFDPDKGVRFSSYAAWYVKARMLAFVYNNYGDVRLPMTPVMKKTFFHLNEALSELGIYQGRCLSADSLRAVAEYLDVPEECVQSVNAYLHGGEVSLNKPFGSGQASKEDIINNLADETVSPARAVEDKEALDLMSGFLRTALNDLPERERDIFVKRRLVEEPVPLADLSKIYNVSKERIRHIEIRTCEKIERKIGKAFRNLSVS